MVASHTFTLLVGLSALLVGVAAGAPRRSAVVRPSPSTGLDSWDPEPDAASPAPPGPAAKGESASPPVSPRPGTGSTRIHEIFSPGRLVVKQESISDTVTILAGQKKPEEHETDAFVWELDVAAGNASGEKVIKGMLRRIRVDRTGSETRSWDSGDPAVPGDPDLARVLTPLVGAGWTATLDSDEQVVEVTGLDQTWDSVARKLSDPASQALIAEYRVGMGDRAIEMNLRRMRELVPREAVDLHSRWKSGLTLTLPIVGEVRVRYDCELVDATPGTATIHAIGLYKNRSPRIADAGGVRLNIMNLTTEEDFTMQLSLKDRRVLRETGASKFKMDYMVPTQEGQEVQGSTSSRIHDSFEFERPGPGTTIAKP